MARIFHHARHKTVTQWQISLFRYTLTVSWARPPKESDNAEF